MSGGVDSSVTAALLKEQGYRVIGLFMKNWEEKDENGVCTSTEDANDAARVCDQLEIPFYAIEFVAEYRDRVFSQFLKEYEAGHTPNPDILCNREIKFDAFYNEAMKLGADYLATGHYCRIGVDTDGKPALLKGLDPLKDQSYFLHAIDGAKLAKVLFPIGDLPKTEVRKIAARLDLATKTKKDSTGICFIGERNFKPFLEGYLKSKPGDFRTLDGKKVGRHTGSQFYTIGQRKGLGLGGEGEPWFVVKKDVEKNVVYVERGEFHPALYSDALVARELSWIAGIPPASPGVPLECKAKVRYRQKDQDCILTIETDVSGVTIARVRFPTPQRAITLGQSVVFYQDDICLGGGVIREVAESFHARGAEIDGFQKQLPGAVPA